MLPECEFTCQRCRNKTLQLMPLTGATMSWVCHCGKKNTIAIALHIGQRLLQTATWSYHRKDYNGSIVYSSFAVDCRLSQVCLTHMEITEYKKGNIEINNEDLEKKLRHISSTIKCKFNYFENLICPEGIQNFIKKNADLSLRINEGFPSLGVITFVDNVIKEVFWRRNHIIHVGDKQYGEEIARRVINVSSLVLDVIEMVVARGLI